MLFAQFRDNLCAAAQQLPMKCDSRFRLDLPNEFVGKVWKGGERFL
jgi:hypothetical protein